MEGQKIMGLDGERGYEKERLVHHSIMPKTETSGDDAAVEWSTPGNWEEDPAIKAINGEDDVSFSTRPQRPHTSKYS